MDRKKLNWLREQVNGFAKHRGTYELLAKTLEKILRRVCDRYAPTARVGVRAKSIASFAEKALRKFDKYKNPLQRMTDLAGARIVVYSLAEADAVCRFIEDLDREKRGLRIDWENSRNVRRSLRTSEFGYNGVHYIVELRGDNILGVKVPSEVRSKGGRPRKWSLKAEIQVHTALQNVWSTIGHDRLYKTQIRVPQPLRREIHAVAATLESIDQEFAEAVEALDRYIRQFQAYRPPERLQDEIDEWKEIHQTAPHDKEATYQLGRLLMLAERWDEAYQTLRSLRCWERPDVQMAVGQAAWFARRPRAEAARHRFRKALQLAPRDWRVYCALAETYLRTGDLRSAIEYYGQAFSLCPEEPAVLSPLVECHIRRDGSLDKLKLMQGALEAARCECHQRAERGVFVPQAHFACARLNLYRGKAHWYDAANSYCIALASCHLPQMVLDELDSLTAMLRALRKDGKWGDGLVADDKLAGFEWARRLMIVALAARASAWEAWPKKPGAKAWREAGRDVRQELRALATQPLEGKKAFPLPVVIVAGGCRKDVEKDLSRKYGKHLGRAFKCFSGTIISGGTTAGVSGMVGSLSPSPGRTLHRVAYLPKSLPGGDQRCKAYEEVRTSPGKGYNPAGVLQTWADILLQGLRPNQVRILGINGGRLTEFELRLGLALGAVVGVVADSKRVVKTLLSARTECRPKGLVPLPTDAATWAAFIRGASPELRQLPPKKIEPAAKQIHEQFCKDNLTNTEKHDASVLPWDKLPKEYKESSRQQVRFATLILDALGYKVVKDPRPAALRRKRPIKPADYENKVPAMAELEHGRFCAERLESGWRYGPKDLKRKRNPTIVPWRKLPRKIRRYDFTAVRDFPKWLARAGLKIVRRHKKALRP